MKKLLTVLLSILLVAVLLPFALHTASAETLSGTCGDDLTWTFDEETGTLTIEGTGKMWDYDSTEFDFALWDDLKPRIRHIEVGDGVTSIGDETFYDCTALKTVDFPDGMTEIGCRAFFNCTALKAADFPDGMTEIGAMAFYNCTALTEITLPESIDHIGNDAFKGTAWWEALPDGSCYNGGTLLFYKGQSPKSVTVKDGKDGATWQLK